MNERIMNGRAWLLLTVMALAIIGLSSIASASNLAGGKTQTGGGADARHAQDKDGFDQLPPGYKAVSMSTLVSARRVLTKQTPPWHRPITQRRRGRTGS